MTEEERIMAAVKRSMREALDAEIDPVLREYLKRNGRVFVAGPFKLQQPEQQTTRKATMSIKLGDKVKDTVTSFTGVVLGRAEYLHEETACWVQPEKVKDDGKMVESKWITEKRLTKVEE